MTDVHFIISGRVQGVGFRRFVLNVASKNNLAGWVRNTQEGTVEVYAAGESENIAHLISACQKGPIFALVNELMFSDNKNIPLICEEQGGSKFFIWR